MATSTAKSNALQVIEAPMDVSLATGQVLLATIGLTQVKAPMKMLVLAVPVPTNAKSNALQVIEGDINSVSLVTTQVLYAPVPGTESTALMKEYVLQPVTSIEVSNVTLEVVGESTITPPLPGQIVTWFDTIS